MSRISLLSLSVALVWASGCAPPVEGDPEKTAYELVGASGGEVLAKNGVGVVVPAGALRESAMITVAPASLGQPPPLSMAVGEIYEFGPEGQTFTVPAKVRLAIDPTRMPIGYSIAQVVIQRAATGTSAYERLVTRVVDSTHVEADTVHFSVFVPTLDTSTGSNDAGTDAGTCSETCAGGNDAGLDCGCSQTCGETVWEIQCSGSEPLGCACVRNGVQTSSFSLNFCPAAGDIARHCIVATDGGYDGGTYDGGYYDGGYYDGGTYDGGTYDGGTYDGGTYDGGTYDGGYYDGGTYDGGTYDGGYYDGGTYDGGYYDGGTYDGGSYDGGSYDGGSYDGGSYDGGYYDGGTYDGGTYDGGYYDGGYYDGGYSDAGSYFDGGP